MTVTYRDGVSILELIVYFPCLFLALWLAIRHGIFRSSGWYFLIIFALIRIVGSCCQLGTISNPSSIGLNTAAVICSSIGLSPLILTCVGLLARAYGFLYSPEQSSEQTQIDIFISNGSSTDRNSRKSILPPWIFHALMTLTLVALVLCIVGAVKSSDSGSSSGFGKPETLTKVGIIIFVAAWACLCLLLIAMVISASFVAKGEHRLIIAVAICVPFILVRLIYSLLVVFANNQHFNIVTGSVTINLVMAVLEEFVVTIVCIGVGLSLQVRPKSIEHVDPAPHGEKMMARHVSQHVRPRRKGGPITRLVRMARDRWA